MRELTGCEAQQTSKGAYKAVYFVFVIIVVILLLNKP